MFLKPIATSSGVAPMLLLVKRLKSSFWDSGLVVSGSMYLMVLSEAEAVHIPSLS